MKRFTVRDKKDTRHIPVGRREPWTTPRRTLCGKRLDGWWEPVDTGRICRACSARTRPAAGGARSASAKNGGDGE